MRRAKGTFVVVRGYQLETAFAEGWRLVCEDPFPHMFAPWSRDAADDGA